MTFRFFVLSLQVEMETEIPRIAIIDPNTLAALGLKQLLTSLIPVMQADVYTTMAELSANHPENYVHYFVAMNVVLEHMDFFAEQRRKTIVMTMSAGTGKLSVFRCVNVNVPENELVKSLLMLEQYAHGGNRNLPPLPNEPYVLTNREAEVMVLIVKGYINKEIAEQLRIGLSTVITHRKNIMEKLGIRSVSALTIYAVMHGYVDINKI